MGACVCPLGGIQFSIVIGEAMGVLGSPMSDLNGYMVSLTFLGAHGDL